MTSEGARKILLLSGVASAALYAGMTAFIPLGWSEYSSLHQTVSELSALGAPTRALWIPLGIAYTVLVTAFGFGVRAWFRVYSFATLATLLLFGVLASLEAPNIAKNLPTPWIGVWERINIAVFLAWMVVLGLALWRDPGRRAARPAPAPSIVRGDLDPV